MTDIRTSLAEGDPLVIQPALSRDDIQAMRRRVLAGRRAPLRRGWTWTVTLAAALAGVVIAGVGITRRADPGGVPMTGHLDGLARSSAEDGRRQLQFATPGGTRVIWVFNEQFATEVQ